MNIFSALKSGWSRSVLSWKGIMIQWIVSLIMASILAVILKSIVKTGFGPSMITERFMNGFNVEAFSDLGPVFKVLTASLAFGTLFLLLVNFLTNAFITGGLFESVRKREKEYTGPGFWNAAAGYFLPFFFIQVFSGIILLFSGLLIIGIPVLIAATGKGISEKTIFEVILACCTAFAVVLPVILLVADYARAWLVSNHVKAFFGSIGYGFRQTFRTFGKSWLLMITLILMQLIFLLFCFVTLRGRMPSSSGGVFMLFLFSQLIFILRIFLRVVRYGSVTVLMEQYEQENALSDPYSADYVNLS